MVWTLFPEIFYLKDCFPRILLMPKFRTLFPKTFFRELFCLLLLYLHCWYLRVLCLKKNERDFHYLLLENWDFYITWLAAPLLLEITTIFPLTLSQCGRGGGGFPTPPGIFSNLRAKIYIFEKPLKIGCKKICEMQLIFVKSKNIYF